MHYRSKAIFIVNIHYHIIMYCILLIRTIKYRQNTNYIDLNKDSIVSVH